MYNLKYAEHNLMSQRFILTANFVFCKFLTLNLNVILVESISELIPDRIWLINIYRSQEKVVFPIDCHEH